MMRERGVEKRRRRKRKEGGMKEEKNNLGKKMGKDSKKVNTVRLRDKREREKVKRGRD